MNLYICTSKDQPLDFSAVILAEVFCNNRAVFAYIHIVDLHPSVSHILQR